MKRYHFFVCIDKQAEGFRLFDAYIEDDEIPALVRLIEWSAVASVRPHA